MLDAGDTGLGKRVPVTQFRLQRRSGLGLRALKFRHEEDELAALWVDGDYPARGDYPPSRR